MQMKLSQIFAIHDILTKLSKQTLSIGYHVAKNLRIAAKYINEFNAIRDEEVQKRALKDANGNVRLALYDAKTREVIQEDYPQPQSVKELPEGTVLGALFATNEEHDECENILNEAFNADHEVEWFTIDESKIETLVAPAELIEPLLDTIIVSKAQVATK